MNWYKVFIPETDLYNRTNRLLTEFLTYYQQGMTSDNDAVLLTEYLTKGIVIYFSPGAAELAHPLLESYHAENCTHPFGRNEFTHEGDTLSFLAGDYRYYKNLVVNYS